MLPTSFACRIDSRTAAGLLADEEGPADPIWVEHVDGADMRPAKKAQILHRFAADEPTEHRMLSNVKLLVARDEATLARWDAGMLGCRS